MDLEKLEIYNFKCFKDFHRQDFTDSSIWVFKGKNGSGKSSFVCDALMYALFNKTPSMEGTQKLNDQFLINEKRRSMSVQVWFKNNGSSYSIKRTLNLKGKKKITTDHLFEVWQDNKQITTIPNKRESEAWVRNNLWNSNDFRNTTIILQKEITDCISDTAGDRKSMIERIFKIDRFAIMSEISKEKRKFIDDIIKDEESDLKHLEERLLDPKQIETDISNLKTELDLKTKSQKSNKEKSTIVKDSIERINKLESQGSLFKEKIKSKEDQKTSKEKKIHELNQKMHKISEFLDKEPEILKIQKEIEIIETELKKLEKILDEIKHKELELKNTRKLRSKTKLHLESDIKNKTSINKRNKEEISKIVRKLEEISKGEKNVIELEKDVSKKIETEKKYISLQKEYQDAFQLSKDILVKETELRNKKREIDVKLKELIFKNKKISKLKLEQEKIGTDIEQSNNVVQEFDTLKSTIENETKDLFKCEKRVAVLNKEKITFEEDIILIEEELKDIITLKGGKCPKCKQSLDEIHINEIKTKNNESKQKLSNDITELSTKIDNLMDKIEEFNSKLKLNKKDLKVKEKEKENRIKIEEKSKSNLVKINELKLEITPLEDLKNKFEGGLLLKDKEEELKLLNKKLPVISKIKEQIEKSQKEKTSILLKENEIKTIKKQIKEKINIENEKKRYNIDLTTLVKEIQNLKHKIAINDYALEEKNKILTLTSEISKIKSQLPNLDELTKRLTSKNPDKIKKQVKELETSKTSKTLYSQQLKELENECKVLENDGKELRKQLTNLKLEEQLKKRNEIKIELTTLENEMNDLLNMIATLNSNLDAKNKLNEDNKSLIKKKNDLKKNLSVQIEKRDDYGSLELIFKEIGKRILNRVLTKINLYSSEILNRLGNEQLEQITLIESKNGFELKIISEGVERDPAWFSGGQLVRIGLAFRLSLSKTLAEITENEIETIIIDEGDFGALDDEGLIGVAEILNELQMFFKRIILITHMDRLVKELEGNTLTINNGKIISES